MYSESVEKKKKKAKISELVAEQKPLLLGCQLFSAETFRYMAQQTPAK